MKPSTQNTSVMPEHICDTALKPDKKPSIENISLIQLEDGGR